MKKLYFSYIVIALLTLCNIVLIMSLRGSKKSGYNPSGPKNIIVKKLEFDEKQVKDYQVLIDQHRKMIRENDLKILDTKNQLYNLLIENNIPNKSDSLINEIATIQKNIETIHFNHFLDIKAICKPDQEEKFNNLTKELAHIFNHKKHLSKSNK